MENDKDDTFKCVCEKGFIGEYCQTGEVIYTNDFTTKSLKKLSCRFSYLLISCPTSFSCEVMQGTL